MLVFNNQKLTALHQSEAAECGLACLAMVAGYHGYSTDLAGLRRRFPVSLNGVTLQNLISIADQLGFASRPLRTELEGLKSLQAPAILYWDMVHFTVSHKSFLIINNSL